MFYFNNRHARADHPHLCHSKLYLFNNDGTYRWYRYRRCRRDGDEYAIHFHCAYDCFAGIGIMIFPPELKEAIWTFFVSHETFFRYIFLILLGIAIIRLSMYFS